MLKQVINCNGEVYLDKAFLKPDQAHSYFETLLTALAWQEEFIKIYGKSVKVPRLVCWYGDPGTDYRYSGMLHEPLPWIEPLEDLRQQIRQSTYHSFNSVLANLYRDKNDSMGWHSDKEKELGEQPAIASLSLGETRLFKLQHNKTKEIIDVELTPGSLLMMTGDLQRYWRHCVPKSKKNLGLRINLTFRTIYTV